jgi:hypothetical protein
MTKIVNLTTEEFRKLIDSGQIELTARYKEKYIK